MVLWLGVVGLVAFWAASVFLSYTMGGYVHVLLAAALLATLVKLVLGRKVTEPVVRGK